MQTGLAWSRFLVAWLANGRCVTNGQLSDEIELAHCRSSSLQHECTSIATSTQQHCTSNIALLQQQCSGSASAMLQQCIANALSLQQQCTPKMKRQCDLSVSTMQQQCSSAATFMQLQCTNTAGVIQQQCSLIGSAMQLQCPSDAASKLPQCGGEDSTTREPNAKEGPPPSVAQTQDPHKRNVSILQALREKHPSGKDCPPPKGRFYSESGEDSVLYQELFCGKRNGVFVEIGALDGNRISNTKFFEDTMGWKGGLIEGSPATSAQLSKNRPNPQNLIIPEAVCPEGVGRIDYLINNDNRVSGIPQFMARSFKKTWYSGSADKRGTTVKVPCRPLSRMMHDIANHTKSGHVDLFSLDVEGGELMVLQTNDWKVPVHYFMVEMDGLNKTKDSAVRQLLYSRGYEKITLNIPMSEVFVLTKYENSV